MNVKQNNMKDDKNNVLYRVPPTGASGISTAIFADKVLNPLKILKSIIGVFPAAINTIIVSPTALPIPIITALKIPGLALGNTIFNAVCHFVAPNASDPEIKCSGTFDNASSDIVKIIGITAKPIAIPIIKAFL